MKLYLFHPFIKHVALFRFYSICEKRNKDDGDGIPHIVGHINNDLYAIPVKKISQHSPEKLKLNSPEKEWNNENPLPPGWEKHEGINASIVIF